MQAKIEQAKAILDVLEQNFNSMSIDDAKSKALELMLCLKKIFESPKSLSEAEQHTLIILDERLNKFCITLSQAKENSKSELSKLVQNKKKVGLYNQLK
ncbi:hypothetical protein ACSFVZ_08190 [Pseudoalteromonas sp. SYSU M81236]|jgi:hypothetical protein|uniref:hypothetical protein n=1 Tax=Pseudoalteromonas sp. SYSU M81236 TaxID=3447014 RepID=UPI003F00EFBA